MVKEIVVDYKILQAYTAALFQARGLAAEDANFVAKSLVDTNLWGIDSHGVMRAPIYLKRLETGAINAQPEIKTVKSAITMEVMDGDDGAGQVVGRVAMERAIQLAEQYNMGMVLVHRSNHFGAAAIYSRMAAEKGMIGLAMTNVVRNVVAPGGSKPVIGNNPFAVAIPTYGAFPFVLDISLSSVAGGKLLLAKQKGEKIPMDWATDLEGRPTDDPEKAFNGFLLPVGGHKGLGLAYIVDILSGVISGGVFLDAMKGMYKYPDDPSLTCFMMTAVNVKAIMLEEEMKERMGEFASQIKSSPMWDENREMMIPGEIEYRSSVKRKEQGIPLAEKLYDELMTLGKELGVSTAISEL